MRKNIEDRKRIYQEKYKEEKTLTKKLIGKSRFPEHEIYKYQIHSTESLRNIEDNELNTFIGEIRNAANVTKLELDFRLIYYC